MYRPPDSSAEIALSTIKEQIEQLTPPPGDILLVGDINVDLLRPSVNRNNISNFEQDFSLTQLITWPTRITLHSQTLIDHLYISNPELYHHHATINPGLSHHSLIFTSRKKGKITKERETRFIRSYKNFDQIAFDHDVRVHNCDSVYACKDVNEAVSCLHFELSQIINDHMPLKK